MALTSVGFIIRLKVHIMLAGLAAGSPSVANLHEPQLFLKPYQGPVVKSTPRPC